jgi:hypothetical protein
MKFFCRGTELKAEKERDVALAAILARKKDDSKTEKNLKLISSISCIKFSSLF